MGRTRTLPDHVCPTCQRSYHPVSADQIYCSRECYRGSIYPRMDTLMDVDLRDEVAAAKRERATAPPYRFWQRHA